MKSLLSRDRFDLTRRGVHHALCVRACAACECGVSASSLAEGSVPEGSVTQAVLLRAQFYKKTKQLPVLGRCCDEIQPHQWRPPVEREEHRLPFWLKVGPAPPQTRGGRQGRFAPPALCP